MQCGHLSRTQNESLMRRNFFLKRSDYIHLDDNRLAFLVKLVRTNYSSFFVTGLALGILLSTFSFTKETSFDASFFTI